MTNCMLTETETEMRVTQYMHVFQSYMDACQFEINFSQEFPLSPADGYIEWMNRW